MVRIAQLLNNGSRKFYFCFILLSCLVFNSHAAVKLPAIIGDNMVLQQKSKVKLWGLAKPLSKVLIHPSWSTKQYTTIADNSGAWETLITTSKAGGPFQISFNDGDELIVKNILLGEVWVCSGQSNMVMPLKGYDKGQDLLNGEQLIAGSGKYKNIRIFTVPKVISAVPLTDCKGDWKLSSPENAPNFSAIGYQYAKILNEKLNVPVGIISTSWGSTAVQSWMSEANLKQFPEVSISSRLDTMKIPAKNSETVTAVLFNAMISPFTKYGIKGFLWYQGESNKNPPLYQKLFPAMVQEWRNVWDRGNLPFYYVQIAPFKATDRNTAFIREAQKNAIIPNSGMVVALDAGKSNRIHPPDKTVLSERLAYWALAETYKQKGVAYKNPEFKSAKFSSKEAVLTFKNVYKGLKSKDGTLVNFEIAGSDKVFYPAVATITGTNQVHVTSDKVSQPIAVRYAFKSWVDGDLFNSENLPASSFRTDDFEIK